MSKFNSNECLNGQTTEKTECNMAAPHYADVDVPGMMAYIKARFQNLKDQFTAALLEVDRLGNELENPDICTGHSISEICLACTEFENAWRCLCTANYELDGFGMMLDCIAGETYCELPCKDGTLCDRTVPIPVGVEFHGGIDWDSFEQQLPEGVYERLVSSIKFSYMECSDWLECSDSPALVHVLSAFLRESHYIAFKFCRTKGTTVSRAKRQKWRSMKTNASIT